ncbi:MAG: sulfotransferase family protein [Pseudomonadales bacterium]
MLDTKMPDTAELPQRVIAVLGMHRSGTSCVTGSLQNYGLFLGEHSTWNKYNTRGNRENQSIVDLNDKVLKSNGGDWIEPPNRVVWQEEHLQEARSILAEYKEQPLFGFKDPRTLLTLNGWQSILGDRLQFVGIFRHPNAVVNSLQSRAEIDRELALGAWQRYNTVLLETRVRCRFPMLCFDWPEPEFLRKMARTASKMGLKQISDESFYTRDLKHHAAQNTPLSKPLTKTLKQLQAQTRFPYQWL